MLTTTIEIKGLKLQAFHGVLPQEHAVGNAYRIDLTIEAGLAAAMKTDRLADTLDYAAAVKIVQEEMAIPSALLEHAAGRILRRVAATWPQARKADLRIAKQTPPVGGEVESCAFRVECDLRELP